MLNKTDISSQNKHWKPKKHPDLFLDPGLDRGLISKDDFHLKKIDYFSQLIFAF